MRVLFAAAEIAPVARVGGLAEAAAGMVGSLRDRGVAVDVVIPDYGGVALAGEVVRRLEVPDWVGDASVRVGDHDDLGVLHLVDIANLARPHPYVDEVGEPWPDNEARFMGFAAAVAALADDLGPDLLHLNDWHTASATVFTKTAVPTILTIHTLGYQGVMEAVWLDRLPRDADRFEWYGGTNPLAGGIQLADAVTTVSPNYAAEIVRSESGMGLDAFLAARGGDLVGIRNGIDTAEWNPATDPAIAANYDHANPSGKTACRDDLLGEVGWGEAGSEMLVGVVSRLVHQKGIDLLLETVPFLEGLGARLVVLGSGEPALAEAVAAAADAMPDRVWFRKGYDVALAHRIFAGADLLAMPSRFEPCGLAQMQAMAYGTVPVVTPVGGLVDTVVDADASRRGTGFVAAGVNGAALVDALHRSLRSRRSKRRWDGIRRRGMEIDWSWALPAAQYEALYERVATF